MANIVKKLNPGQVVEENVPLIGTAAADLITITTGKAASYFVESIQSEQNFGNITLTADKYSSIEVNEIGATKVGNIKITAALDATVEATVGTENTAPSSTVGNITVDAASFAEVDLTVNAFVQVDASTNGKSATVGNVLVNSNGAGADTNVSVVAGTAKLGTVTVNAKGRDSEAYIEATSSGAATGAGTLQGGSIGNVALTASGTNSYTEATNIQVAATGGSAALTGSIGNITATASARDSYVYTEEIDATNSNIGNITGVASGFDSDVEFNDIGAVGGNVGNVTLTASGAFTSAYASVEVEARTGLTGTSLLGGNVGNITLKASGLSSEVDYDVLATGTFEADGAFTSAVNIGNFLLDITGVNASSDVNLSTANGGNIGNITINNKANGAETNLNASTEFGNIKNITVNNTGVAAETTLNVNATSAEDDSDTPVRIGGNIGNVVLNTTGTDSNLDDVIINAGMNDEPSSAKGSVGNVTISTNGKDAFNTSTINASGNIGTVNLSGRGLGSETGATVNSVFGSIGAITVSAGTEAARAGVEAIAQNGNIAAFNVSATGADATALIAVDAQSVGVTTIKANGANAGAILTGSVSGQNNIGNLVGGTVGNINLSATGTSAYAVVDLDVSGIVVDIAGDYTLANTAKVGNITSNISGIEANSTIIINAALEDNLGVDIGNITAKTSGVASTQNIQVSTGAGNIGNVALSLAGNNANAEVLLNAGSLSANDGKIGNISLASTGIETNIYSAIAAQSSIGTYTATVNGEGSSFNGELSLGAFDPNSVIVKAATLGNTTLTLKGDDIFGRFNVSGTDGSDVGNIALNLQGGSSIESDISLYLLGTATDAARVGNITVAVANANASGNVVTVDVSDSNGIGNITGTVTGGDTAILSVNLKANANTLEDSGSIGNITLTNGSELGYLQLNASAEEIGNITIKTGAQSSLFALLSSSGVAAVNIGAVDVALSTDLTGSIDEEGNVITYFNAGEISISNADNVNGIKVVGGSATSQFMFGVNSSTVSNAVDFGGFNGYSTIGLSNVTAGVSVIGAKAGNSITTTAGNDTITTGAGADDIITNGGLDKIKFLKVATGNVLDTITDFSANSDVLQFSKAGLTGASGFAIASLNAANFTINATGLADDTAAQFIFNTDTSVLSYDADGTGSGLAINIVTLTGVTNLTATDIEII